MQQPTRSLSRCWIGRPGPAALLAVLSASVVHAASDGVGALDEILVTAQRRIENLQSVPIAITTVSGAEAEKAGIHDQGTLADRVPGLTLSPFSQGQNILSIRGVSSNDDGAGTDSSVAVFVDDVYAGRISNINPDLFDVERIEVLRGPQGTLYGKNTIGGAVNIISTRPNTEHLEAHARVEIGNYDRHNFAGMVSGPLSDMWAAKISVATRYAHGWVDDVVLHTPEKDDNDAAARLQLLRTAGNSEILLAMDYQRLAVGDQARIPLTQVTGNLGPLVAEYESVCGDRGPACASNGTPGFARRDTGGASAKATQRIGESDLISITAFRRYDFTDANDAGIPDLPFSVRVSDHTRQYSEEVRWVSAMGRAVKYVTGLWLLREDTDRARAFVIEPTPVDQSDRFRQINHTTSVAGFANADWEVAKDWTVSVGGRYSYDHKSISNDSVHGNFIVINTTFYNQRSASWDKFTPKISLSYQPNAMLNAYATLAQGFKSGGFASAPTSVQDTNPLRPERATNLEVGLKAVLSNRLRANMALFDSRYHDLQIQSFGPPPHCVQTPAEPSACFGAFETFNAGDAEAKGAEIEAAWLATDRLTVSLMYGYLDAKFKTLLLPNADYPVQSGQDMLHAPRNKAHVDVLYLAALGSVGRLEASAAYGYTSNQRGEIEPYAIQPAFGLLDARLAWRSPSDQLEVALWGRNLTDKAWVAHVYTIAGEVFGSYGDPRTYGASLDWRF